MHLVQRRLEWRLVWSQVVRGIQSQGDDSLLRPEMAPPTMPSTGALALDISRFTESCALIYIFPNQPPAMAMNREGMMNAGVYRTTAPNLMLMARVIAAMHN